MSGSRRSAPLRASSRLVKITVVPRGFRICPGLLLCLLLCLLQPLRAAVETEAELRRIEELVAAGALPRRALGQAQREFLQAGYRKTLRRTLLKQDLTAAEIPAMLDAAEGLRNVAKERLDVAMKQVEAGALPARRLAEATEALKSAARQLELAQSRAKIVRQMVRQASAESYFDELEQEELAYKFEGFTIYEMDALNEIDELYYQAFREPPPISAEGDTPLHRSLGLDHAGRVDIAVHPDSEEGMYLTFLLEGWGIPYIAFRSAVPGQSTGPHIHVGPPSERIPVEALPDAGSGDGLQPEDRPASAAER